jgi:hypothetical protein
MCFELGREPRVSKDSAKAIKMENCTVCVPPVGPCYTGRETHKLRFTGKD